VPLAKDDLAAVSQVKTMPDRHVLLCFGDHASRSLPLPCVCWASPK
jgi:hypothetical protein